MDDEQPTLDSQTAETTRDKEKGAVKRRDHHLDEARKVLEEWRTSTYRTKYPYAIWGEEGLMLDVVVMALATYRRWRTLEDLQFAAADWMWKERHADEVLKLLKELDERVDAKKEVAKRAKADARKAATKKRREAKKRARERDDDSSSSSSDEEPLLALVERAPKRPRVSRSHEATRLSTPSPPASPVPLTSSALPSSTASESHEVSVCGFALCVQLSSVVVLTLPCFLCRHLQVKRHPCIPLYPLQLPRPPHGA